MQKSKEWDRETLSLILFAEFGNFIKQRGKSFLDVIEAPHRQRNRIFDEFNDGLGKDRDFKRNPGRPRVRDAEAIAEFTRMIDQFKSDRRTRGKRWSDDEVLRGMLQTVLRKQEYQPLNEIKLAQALKTLRNEMSTARRGLKK